MEKIKKKFVTLNIKEQICFGTLAVSFCVCFLIFTIVTLCCFVLINLCYLDVLNDIDLGENRGMELIGMYISSQFSINSEITKLGFQWLNNFFSSLEKKPFDLKFSEKNIKENFVNFETLPNMYDDCVNRENSRCIFYENFIKDNDVLKDDFIQILMHAIPLLEILSHFKFIEFSKLDTFDKISILSPKIGSLFVYPMEQANDLTKNYKNNNETYIYTNSSDLIYFQNYTKNILNEYLNLFNESLNSGSEDFKNFNYKFLMNKSLVEAINHSPGVLILDDIVYGNTSSFTKQTTTKRTFSLHIEEKENLNSLRLEDKNLKSKLEENTNFLLLGQWNSEIVSAMEENLTFKDTKIIMTKAYDNNEYLATNFGCLYFLKLFSLQNPDIEFQPLSGGNYTIQKCFPFIPAQQIFDMFVKLPPWLSNNYKRKWKFPMINNYRESRDSTNGVNYKVFRSSFPDNFVLNNLNSDFMIFNNFFYYLIKSTRYIEIQNRFIYHKFLIVMFRIFFLNVLLWLLILIIMIFIMNKVSKDLTTPIENLIEHIKNIGNMSDSNLNSKLEENTKDLDKINCKDDKDFKNLDKINYKDDKDINDMFTLCKDLIKGGFRIVNNRKKEKQRINFINSWNTISKIKTNNLKLNENKIEEDYNKSVKNVMNFKSSRLVEKSRIENEHIIKIGETVENSQDNIFPKLSIVEVRIILQRIFMWRTVE
jgi:hypothetical protein